LSTPVEQAIGLLGRGGLVAYPTETVWGLGADAARAEAVGRVVQWKGRSSDKAFPVLVGGLASLEKLGVEVGPLARELAEAFWPGPLTLVLPSRACLAPGVARGDGALGVRVSAHPVAHALATGLERAGGGPLVATSFNRSGEAPARSRAEAERLCRVCPAAPPRLLDASPDAEGGEPSAVLDLTGPRPALLRSGALAASLAPFLAAQ